VPNPVSQQIKICFARSRFYPDGKDIEGKTEIVDAP